MDELSDANFVHFSLFESAQVGPQLWAHQNNEFVARQVN